MLLRGFNRAVPQEDRNAFKRDSLKQKVHGKSVPEPMRMAIDPRDRKNILQSFLPLRDRTLRVSLIRSRSNDRSLRPLPLMPRSPRPAMAHTRECFFLRVEEQAPFRHDPGTFQGHRIMYPEPRIPEEQDKCPELPQNPIGDPLMHLLVGVECPFDLFHIPIVEGKRGPVLHKGRFEKPVQGSVGSILNPCRT